MATSTTIFTIQPAKPAEVPTLVEIFDLSFRSEASERLFPRTPDVRAWWEKTFEGFLDPKPDRPQSHIFTAKDEAGSIVGLVIWWTVPPGGIKPFLERVPELAPSLSRERIVEWGEQPLKNNHKYMGGVAHVCECSLLPVPRWWFGDISRSHLLTYRDVPVLDTLAVRDTCRGQGLGENLTRAVTQEADNLGYPAYLDATLKAISLYERTGFVVQPKGDSRPTPMVRPSKTRSA